MPAPIACRGRSNHTVVIVAASEKLDEILFVDSAGNVDDVSR